MKENAYLCNAKCFSGHNDRLTIIALCMVVVVETPTRLLKQPSIPKRRAFLLLNLRDMKQEKNATKVASENQKAELRTAFAMPQFMAIVENLQKAVAEIEGLMSRYDEGDKRRLLLIDMSNTITQELYGKLEGIVGSDFLECSMNVLSTCKE